MEISTIGLDLAKSVFQVHAVDETGKEGHQEDAVQMQLAAVEKEFLVWHRSSEVSLWLATIPGIGVISATALAASVTDPQQFRSSREFAAWLGLTPLQNSSGGKERMGRISKMGDKDLRRLLVVGMTSLVWRARVSPTAVDPRINDLIARKPVRLATVAMANRTARINLGRYDPWRNVLQARHSGAGSMIN